ncbi:hypothetical protein I4U23_005456 [Adineta vaga]|nr:hypothetical protein I4U23_005456 [Adineta vaga]
MDKYTDFFKSSTTKIINSLKGGADKLNEAPKEVHKDSNATTDATVNTDKKSNFSGSKSKSPYSNKKLNCNGRACVECGHCRDWYWRPDGNDKDYTKRDDATCTSDGYDRGFRLPFRDGLFLFKDDDDDDDRRRNYYHFIYSVTYHDGTDVIDNRLCQCDDNRC